MNRSFSTPRAALTVLGVLAAIGGARGAGASAPVLPGQLVVEASAPTQMDFVVAFDTSLVSDGGGESSAVSIEGHGRAIGLVIVPRQATPDSDSLRLLSVPQCGPAGCTSGRTEYVAGYLDSDQSTESKLHTLPAGEYTLHLVTDGTPVRVTLDTAESGGETWRPTVPTSLTWANYAPARTGPYATAAGKQSIAGPRGILFNFLSFKSQPHVIARWAPCYYGDREPVMVLPGCPGGSQGTIAGSDYIGPPSRAFVNWYGSTNVGPAAWTQAWWLLDGMAESITANGFWLDPYMS